MQKVKYALNNETGVSNLEIIVMISLVMVICTALFFFSDQIHAFMGANVKRASHVGW